MATELTAEEFGENDSLTEMAEAVGVEGTWIDSSGCQCSARPNKTCHACESNASRLSGLTTSSPPTYIMWNYAAQKFKYQFLSSRKTPYFNRMSILFSELKGKLVYFSELEGTHDGKLSGTAIWEFDDGAACITWAPIWGSSGCMVNLHYVAVDAAPSFPFKFWNSLPEIPEPDADKVSVNFWSMTPHGPSSVVRKLQATDLADLEPNYSAKTKGALKELLSRTPEDINGRIILLHGEPGLGKTYFIRLLLREWKKWCSGEYLIDAEQFFGSASYMQRLVFEHAQDDTEKFRMIICEDADEFISADGKSTVGQSVSRLFNLADGMVGQGTNTLILLTTNEPIEKFHPALLRPGRSLANIQFEQLSAEESNAWLKAHGLDIAVDGSQSLASLYERLGKGRVVSKAAKKKMGFGI